MMELPPKSILTGTTAIVSACEWAEVSPKSSDKFVLVTELAALLHLGSYTHARHLWHRYRQDAVASSTQTTTGSSSSTEQGATPSSTNLILSEMDQFHRLWNAAQPLLCVQSATMAAPSSFSSSPQRDDATRRAVPSSPLQIQMACRRFYTMLRSTCILQTASVQQQHQPPQQPLATFAEELYQSQRVQMARLMEETFDSIPRTKADHNMDQAMTDANADTNTNTNTATTTGCRLKDLLGFDDTQEMEEFLGSRGWLLENEFWIPGEAYLDENKREADSSSSSGGGSKGSSSTFLPSNGNNMGEEKGQESFGFGLLDMDQNRGKMNGKDEKIHFLTNIVGFMERDGTDLTASREGGGGK